MFIGRYLLERSLGRNTFVPLDAITPKVFHGPKGFQGDSVRPLHNVISCDPRFEKAVQQIFGKFMVCEDMDTAIRVAAMGYTCVTKSGDEVAKRGSIRGGFYDTKRSKLKALMLYKEASMHVRMLEVERSDLRVKLLDQEQAVLRIKDRIDILKLDDHKQQAAKVRMERSYKHSSCFSS